MPLRQPDFDDEGVYPAPVTADLEIDDKILGPFTARQCALLAVGALALWLAYTALHRLVPAPVLLLALLLIGAALAVAVTAKRDGLTLERYAAAGWRHHRAPRDRVTAVPGAELDPGLAPLDLPVTALAEPGVLDLGADGAAALVQCGTVNLALRSGTETGSVLGAFARALNAIGGPFQFTVSAHRVDLGAHADRCEQAAAALAHPLLEARAREHAAFLRELADGAQLTSRRVLLTVREPGPMASAAVTVAQRAAQAAQLLTACGIDAHVLDAQQAAAAVAAACDPARTHRAVRLAPPGTAVRLAVEPDEHPAVQPPEAWDDAHDAPLED